MSLSAMRTVWALQFPKLGFLVLLVPVLVTKNCFLLQKYRFFIVLHCLRI